MSDYYKHEHLTHFGKVSEAVPDLGRKFFDWYGAVFADGALSEREKALIALAVAHAVQCPYCIEAYTDAADTFTIPAWTRFDLGARYATRIAGRAVEVRGRVENLTNRSYWASAGGFPGANYLVLGMPRSFLMSASVDF